MTSISEPMPCFAQKSSISWVSGIPPINEPEMLRRLVSSGKPGTSIGFSGRPSSTSVPSTPSSPKYLPISKLEDTVLRIRSKLLRSDLKVSGSAVA
ncbi:Uncharacterised protein [Mycobacteroides abscessus subsp. abscessus]|nr:Uncharacterised protein [Mycobacteroides abscessus subsp. abscessus]